MNDISDLIATLGFPVAVSAFLVWYITRDLKRSIDTQQKVTEELRKTVHMLSYIIAKTQGVDFEEARKIANIET